MWVPNGDNFVIPHGVTLKVLKSSATSDASLNGVEVLSIRSSISEQLFNVCIMCSTIRLYL